MAYLFLDTTAGVYTCLWDKKSSVLGSRSSYDKKGSQVLHSYIHELLVEAKIKLSELEGIIQISGPGSYTGMRLSAGVADILKWQNIAQYSVYHFELPLLLGYDSGVWVSKAFKGEYFLYSWDNKENSSELVNAKEVNSCLANKNVFSHHEHEWDLEIDALFTSELVQKSMDKLFSILIEEEINRDIYYFRKIEEEFTKPKL